MADLDLPQLVRHAARFQEVVRILAKYGFADWLQATNLHWVRTALKDSPVRELGNLSREERVRAAITELGTTFIKLGQVLSTRPDLVGIELADELHSQGYERVRKQYPEAAAANDESVEKSAETAGA